MKKKKTEKPKRRMEVKELVQLVYEQLIPKKEGDPGVFTIPCIIGNTSISNAMLDLGASINVLSTQLYETLDLEPLHETNVTIQLADSSSTYPMGVIKDVMVKV